MSILLVSREGCTVQVSLDCARVSSVMSLWLDTVNDDNNKTQYHLPWISSSVLVKVGEFCNYYSTHPFNRFAQCVQMSESHLTRLTSPWYVMFITDVDPDMLILLAEASHYLDIPHLLNLVSARFNIIANSNTSDEVRDMFGLWTIE